MLKRFLDPQSQPGWKKVMKVILGCSFGVMIKAALRGPTMAWDASIKSFDACDPLNFNHTARAHGLLRQIPEVKLEDIVGNRKAGISIDIQRHEDGMLPIEHAIALLSIAVLEKPPEVLEIGTFCGHTTKLLAQNLRNSIIHTVDLPVDFRAGANAEDDLPKDDFHLIQKRVVGREYKDQPGAERIVQHFGDTANWDFSPAKAVTLFFIDGSHTYEYVKNDSEKCHELCHGTGVFLWHDCGVDHVGILEFLNEWRQKGRDIVRIQGTTLAYLGRAKA